MTNYPNRNGADEAIRCMKESWYRIVKVFADGGYKSKLIERIKKAFGIEVEFFSKNNEKFSFGI